MEKIIGVRLKIKESLRQYVPLLILCFALYGKVRADGDCPPPYHLNVYGITASTAQLEWEGTNDEYIVMLGQELLVVDADFETGDFSQAAFSTTTPDYPWTIVDFGQGSSFCVKSTNAGVPFSASDLVLEVNVSTDMVISFSSRVSSESSWDRGYFSIDEIEKLSISGETGWQSYSYPLATGPHILRWHYKKDKDGDMGDDCFYVDNIKLGYANSWEQFYTEKTRYTFEGLRDETSYLTKVVGVCADEESDESSTISFTTTPVCRTPHDLNVTNITTKEATLSWDADGGSYYVLLGRERLSVDANFETGNFSQANFSTSSNYPWTVVRSGQGSTYCAKSGNAGMDNTTSSLSLEVNAGSDSFVSFSYKVSSESSYDKGYFSIDDVEKTVASGEAGWTDEVFPLTSGSHTLRWYYVKDMSGNSGGDCFYIDNIKIGNVDAWEEYDTDTLTYIFDELVPKTTYLARVQSFCDYDSSDLSEWVCFTTISGAAVQEDHAEDSHALFAFYDNGLIHVNIEGEATLYIVDVLGRIVSSQCVNGKQIVNVDAKAGIYMLQLVQDEIVRTQKLIVR